MFMKQDGKKNDSEKLGYRYPCRILGNDNLRRECAV